MSWNDSCKPWWKKWGGLLFIGGLMLFVFLGQTCGNKQNYYKIKTEKGRSELRKTLDSANLKQFDVMIYKIQKDENKYNALKTDVSEKILEKSRKELVDSLAAWRNKSLNATAQSLMYNSGN